MQEDTTLKTELYYSEDGAKMKLYNWLLDNNLSLKERGELFKNSKEVDVSGPSHTHITQSLDRYLLPGVGVKIKLYPSTPEFCLLSADENPNF